MGKQRQWPTDVVDESQVSQKEASYIAIFLATLVALHYTPVSRPVSRSFELA